MGYLGYASLGVFVFIVIFGLANNYGDPDNISLVIFAPLYMWLVILAPLYIFIFGRAVPLDVKITPEGSAWVRFEQMGIEELKNAVVRDATDKDLAPSGCNVVCGGECRMSWCESRTIETSIVIEGTMKTLCGTKRFFYCVPRSQEVIQKNKMGFVKGCVHHFYCCLHPLYYVHVYIWGLCGWLKKKKDTLIPWLLQVSFVSGLALFLTCGTYIGDEYVRLVEAVPDYKWYDPQHSFAEIGAGCNITSKFIRNTTIVHHDVSGTLKDVKTFDTPHISSTKMVYSCTGYTFTKIGFENRVYESCSELNLNVGERVNCWQFSDELIAAGKSHKIKYHFKCDETPNLRAFNATRKSCNWPGSLRSAIDTPNLACYRQRHQTNCRWKKVSRRARNAGYRKRICDYKDIWVVRDDTPLCENELCVDVKKGVCMELKKDRCSTSKTWGNEFNNTEIKRICNDNYVNIFNPRSARPQDGWVGTGRERHWTGRPPAITLHRCNISHVFDKVNEECVRINDPNVVEPPVFDDSAYWSNLVVMICSAYFGVLFFGYKKLSGKLCGKKKKTPPTQVELPGVGMVESSSKRPTITSAAVGMVESSSKDQL